MISKDFKRHAFTLAGNARAYPCYLSVSFAIAALTDDAASQ